MIMVHFDFEGNCAWVHPEVLSSIEDGYDYEEVGLKHIEDLGWTVEHKMQSRGVIFQDERSGKYYMLELNREGDDFKGYEHLDYMDTKDSEGRIKCDEVIKEEIVSHIWKEVKQMNAHTENGVYEITKAIAKAKGKKKK
ncbi:hypothetical protein [Bacillus phage CP-51]|uniref:Uncharacterized protein n=1 Tax=Bacillus phage CP-51 TaxID=1391188 RepID=A0A068EN06_9CAUD|nr:hypothetical protein OZ73_gp215 [Bacillus phage CP-51]AID50650.1 hypothetical protein [Bacillus phage CP-51]